MRLRVNHTTSYSYAEPVFLEPHHLYLYPAYRPYISLKSYELNVSPSPKGSSLRIDAEGNNYHQVWFTEPIQKLSIETSFDVELTPINPFDLIIEDKDAFPPALKDFYLYPQEELSPEVKNWIDSEYQKSENTLSFLASLTQEMHHRWKHTIRLAEGVIPANDTFKRTKASCRDLAWLMIQALRHLGFPTKFVSGYAFNPELDGHELHAWVEAWVSGAGWIGLDPSLGLLTTEVYIPLASSHTPERTLPVIGHYRGTASSELSSDVEIKQV